MHNNYPKQQVIMPNDCTNYLTIRFKTENDLHNFASDYTENYPGWNKKIISKGTKGIITTNETAWKPDFEWLKKILEEYDDCFVKDEWFEEGGLAGVWVGQYTSGGVRVIDEMKWLDLSIEEKAFLFGWGEGGGGGR